MMRNFGIFLSYSQIYKTVSLTTVTMLYITASWVIYFITESLYLLTPISQSAYPVLAPRIFFFFFFSKSRQILYQLSYQGGPQFYLKDQYLTMCRSLPYVTPVSEGIQAEFIGQEQRLDSSESPVLTPGSQGVDPLRMSQAHWDSRKHTRKAISPKTLF